MRVTQPEKLLVMRKKKQLKVRISKGPKVYNAKGVQDSFAYILKMVQEKWTISEAVELANVSRKAFYKFITPQQKEELRLARTAFTEVGAKWHMTANGKTKKKSKEESEFSDPDPNDFDFGIEESPMDNWDF